MPILQSMVGAFALVCGLILSEDRFRIGIQHEGSTAVTHDNITISPGSRFRAAMVLAIIADALQIKLVPGVDLVPFWTLAVINVYRKSKRIAVTAEESREQHPALTDKVHKA